MLMKKFDKMKHTCIKLMVCNAVLGFGLGMLFEDLGYNSIPPIFASALILGAFLAILLVIGQLKKELHVPFKRIFVPLGIVMLPMLLVVLSHVHMESQEIETSILMLFYILVMLILMLVWWDKMFKSLPAAFKTIEPQMEEYCPEIFDNGIGRISEKKFLTNMNKALEWIPPKKMNAELEEALADWYSVYVSFCLALEGVFFTILVEISLTSLK